MRCDYNDSKVRGPLPSMECHHRATETIEVTGPSGESHTFNLCFQHYEWVRREIEPDTPPPREGDERKPQPYPWGNAGAEDLLIYAADQDEPFGAGQAVKETRSSARRLKRLLPLAVAAGYLKTLMTGRKREPVVYEVTQRGLYALAKHRRSNG